MFLHLALLKLKILSIFFKIKSCARNETKTLLASLKRSSYWHKDSIDWGHTSAGIESTVAAHAVDAYLALNY